jgi:hypothetical protein
VPNFSPVALFVFRRPAHTQRALESLSRNPELADSPLFIYCDAARRPEHRSLVAETRRVVRSMAPSHARVVERETNRGLARSVVGGVTDLCSRFGSAIVVEDDLAVSPAFLAYMNQALQRYATTPEVMQVSGHMFPVDLPPGSDSVFLPFATSWGWATWARAWERFDPTLRGRDQLRNDPALKRQFDLDGSYPYFRMLEKQVRGEVDSWAIQWYLSIFVAQGLVLYPRQTLVHNDGFDGSGTHGRGGGAVHVSPFAERRDAFRFSEPIVDATAFRAIRAYLRNENRITVKVYRRAMNALRARLRPTRHDPTPQERSA